jgi:hypothetical protein
MILHRWACPEGHFEVCAADVGLGAPANPLYNCPTVLSVEPFVVVCRQQLVHTVVITDEQG